MTNKQGQLADHIKAPAHVAIIMDGNSRWAEQCGLSRDVGHRQGAKNLRTIAERCADLGVTYLSLFAFSTENWLRPKDEVDLLIELIGETLDNELDELERRETRVQFIGDKTRFPKSIQKKMFDCELKTAHYDTLVLTIALNYGGRWDITEAAKELADAAMRGLIKPDEITESVFESHLSTRNLPAPDLCIRTGGDRRISNFMLWDFAYTEFYYTNSYWPGFTEQELELAFLNFERRNRRYGGRVPSRTKQKFAEVN